MQALAEGCASCQVGASISAAHAPLQRPRARRHHMYGYTPPWRTSTPHGPTGRYFTEVEDRHAADVCLIGDRLAQEFFPDADPIGR